MRELSISVSILGGRAGFQTLKSGFAIVPIRTQCVPGPRRKISWQLLCEMPNCPKTTPATLLGLMLCLSNHTGTYSGTSIDNLLCLTNRRIRRFPQAHLVRNTSCAFVSADQFNVLRAMHPFFTQLLSRYRCSPELYGKIPKIIAGVGLSVERGVWMKDAPSPTGEIGCVISDGATSVNLSGGILNNGTCMFLLATIPTLKPWGFGRRNAFYLRVHEILLSNGVEPLGTIPMQNQSTDPTLASGTPPAGQELRHP
jgi:hypothetical protein